ncbi:MAG: accessory Sec system protein Asp3 [Lactobacillus sp.]
MQKIINQIYWNSVKDTVMEGTGFTKYPQNYIVYVNPMIASGKTIKIWRSNLNYQSSKEIPKLPIIASKRWYKVRLQLFTYPENSLIFRINFYGIQGDVIGEVVFTEKEKRFYCPDNTISYSIEIINAGCEMLSFDRIQLSEDSVDDLDFEDVEFKKRRVVEKTEENLILIQDSKRARLVSPDISLIKANVSITTVNVSWQFSGNLAVYLDEWIHDHILWGYRIFSTDKRLDEKAHQVQEIFPQIDVITSEDLGLDTLEHQERNAFIKKDCTDPDWQLIVKGVNKCLRK